MIPDLQYATAPSFVPPANIPEIIREISKEWPRHPPRATPLPLLLYCNGTQEVQNSLAVLLYDFKAVLLDVAEVHRRTGNSVPDTLRVIQELLEKALENNLPLIIKIEPPLFTEIPPIKKAMEKLAANVISLTVLLNRNEAQRDVSEEEFEMVLDPFWVSQEAGYYLVGAWLSEKMGMNSSTILELAAIKEARKYLVYQACPRPQYTLPALLHPLIERLIGATKGRFQKYFPKLHEKLLVNYPDVNSQNLFMKSCILVAIETGCHRLFNIPADMETYIETEFDMLEDERTMSPSVYEGLSSDTRHISILENWYPFDDNRITVPDEQYDVLYATPVRTEKASFIATLGPESYLELTYFKKLVSQEGIDFIVSLPKPTEYSPLNRSYEEDPILWSLEASTKLNDFLTLEEFTYEKEGRNKRVLQLCHKTWEDGTAISPQDLHALIIKTFALKNSDRPFLVHCKAGIGRTGTFCAAYDLYLQFLEHRQKELDAATFQPNILSIVLQMNLQRHKMVQTLDQYRLLHRFVNYLKEHPNN